MGGSDYSAGAPERPGAAIGVIILLLLRGKLLEGAEPATLRNYAAADGAACI